MYKKDEIWCVKIGLVRRTMVASRADIHWDITYPIDTPEAKKMLASLGFKVNKGEPCFEFEPTISGKPLAKASETKEGG